MEAFHRSRRGRGALRLFLLMAAWAALSGGPAHADVYDRLFGPGLAAGGAYSTQDLLRLRDIGGFDLSPDGRWIAFSVRQAQAGGEDYDLRWFIADTARPASPAALAVPAGRPITFYSGGLHYGFVASDPPKWSPDGRFLALRRRIGDRIGLWIVEPGKGRARLVADGTAQVIAFNWAADRLVFKTGFNAAAYADEVRREAARGWRLDARMTLWAARTPSPVPPDCVSRVDPKACDNRFWVAAPGGAKRPADAREAAVLDGIRPPGAALSLAPEISEGEGAPSRVWGELKDPVQASAMRPFRRPATDSPFARVPCAAPACFGQAITGIGLAADRRSVWFIKRFNRLDDVTGPLDRVGLFVWRLSTGTVQAIWTQDGALENCEGRGEAVFCLQSAPLQPPRIVAIGLADGALRSVADPNPGHETKLKPRVEEVDLRDSSNNRGFAHLVYPAGPRPAAGWPLVVVQYRSRGFLRGGTGEEYPILPLAAAGYLVLNADMPMDLRTQAVSTPAATMRSERLQRAGAEHAAEAIDQAVDALVARGVADPGRLAITGLSYGAEVVHYELQHSARYAAAVASQGGADVSYLAQFGDPDLRARWQDSMGQVGLLPVEGDSLLARAWSQRPMQLRTPLLLNLGQDEAYFGFEGFAALHDAGRPLEVRVFPDEGHLKYKPASFAGIYRNNLLWLDFWLRDRVDPDPALAQDYARWRALKEKMLRDRVTGPPDPPAATRPLSKSSGP